MTSVLLTGSTGFIGQALAKEIYKIRDLNLTVALRREQNPPEVKRHYVVGDLSAGTDWSLALSGQQVVIHAAALVQAINPGSLAQLRAVNVHGALNLAKQAALAGVKRFVYVSSIKVNGEGTQINKPYRFNDTPAPEDAYGISKAEVEAGLKLLSQETGLEIVIIRPPLVYGPRVKGNFSTMLRWLQRGLPLPLGSATENRRSLVALANLVDLLVTCIDHPAAANKTFLVSDGEDMSTTGLLLRLGEVMGKPACLLPMPPAFLQAVARLLGKGTLAQRLLGNLQVDMSHTCQTLNWKPPISVDEGLRRVVQGLGE